MRASMLASAVARSPRVYCSSCDHWSLERTNKKRKDGVRFTTVRPKLHSSFETKRSFGIRASDPRSEESRSGVGKDDEALGIQKDLNYLWKLGAGSIALAAVIKYGSIILPEITRPNIIQALFMILTPVVIALALLLRQSYVEQ